MKATVPGYFVELIKKIAIEAARSVLGVEVKYGTIPSGYTSGRPTVQFDGEDSAGARTWPYLSIYTPAADDRVIVLLANNSGVVLGDII